MPTHGLLAPGFYVELDDIVFPPTVFDLFEALEKLKTNPRVACYPQKIGDQTLIEVTASNKAVFVIDQQEAENFYIPTLPELPYGPE